MDLQLDGKAVVISGGARGIGFACAEAFAREGARVAILDWDADALAAAEAALRAMGAEVVALQTDVSNGQAVDAAHAKVIETFGGIDVGFNNAGLGSKFQRVEDISEEDWDRVIDINLKGVWLCVRAQVRHMRQRNQGAIVNTASNVAFVGAPGAVAYVASKHGIIGITRAVALELASTNVRINAVAPGAIRTDIGKRAGTIVDPYPDALIRKGLPIGRFGEPSEVADAVLWLASPRSSLALGETLVIDGGFITQ